MTPQHARALLAAASNAQAAVRAYKAQLVGQLIGVKA